MLYLDPLQKCSGLEGFIFIFQIKLSKLSFQQNKWCTDPSIHFLPFIRCQVVGATVWAKMPIPFPGQPTDSPSSMSYIFPYGLLPVGHAWKPPRGSSTAPLNVKDWWLYYELHPCECAPYRISKFVARLLRSISSIFGIDFHKPFTCNIP